MLDNQKSSSCKVGLGFDSNKASTSGTKPIIFVGSSAEKATDGSTIKVYGSTLPGSVSRTDSEISTEQVFSPPMSSRLDFIITRKKRIHNRIDESKKLSLKPSPKSVIGYVKTESRSKTSPPRRNISSQPRHNIPQPRRNFREPIHENFYPINWNNHQSQGFVCLRTCLEPDKWIKDSGCSKHMTGNKSLFSTYKAYDGCNVDFGSNLKGKIIGKEEGTEIIKDGKIIGNGIRKNGLYIMKLGNKSQDKLCLATVVDNSTLWHRRLGHANMSLIQSLSSKELVRNLPKLKYDKHFCDACKIRKQAHASHKAKNMVSTKRFLELLHMDLFGPSEIKSYGGNLYTLVVVDDYSSSIIAIRMDHGQEFDNEVQFRAYCDAQGITYNFSAPHTPQSNGVVERKNRTIQEMSRTMLNEQSIPQNFWYNAVDTSTYILNRILIRPILGKNPYEIFKGRKPFLEYFKVFGSKCFILNTKDYLTKFDPKSYEGVFLGYSQNSKAYIVLNKHTMKVKESLNVAFDESPPPTKLSPLVDDDVGEEEAIIKNTKVVNNNEEDESIEVDKIVNIKESKNHPPDQSIFSLCFLFHNPFSSTTMGGDNHIRTLGDYSKPSHEVYRNAIELPVGNNVVPLRSDTNRLVQNRCSFHGLRSEDPNQHLKDFLKLVDSLDFDGVNREKERACIYFNFPFPDQAKLMTSRAPEKVLIREEAKFPVTKNVNSISLTRGEEERSEKTNVTTDDDFEKPTKIETKMPVKEAEKEDEAENKPNRKAEKEETTEAPSS
ncbi:retrovirus-related pol polyprotein from transposon TNT 1-94 [Tanacetum coccineum]